MKKNNFLILDFALSRILDRSAKNAHRTTLSDGRGNYPQNPRNVVNGGSWILSAYTPEERN